MNGLNQGKRVKFEFNFSKPFQNSEKNNFLESNSLTLNNKIATEKRNYGLLKGYPGDS